MTISSSVLAVIFATICPSVSPTQNLVRNPSFEERGDMGDPAHWGWWGSQAGELADAEVFQWEAEGHSGEGSVSIREERWGRRGWWYTVIHGVKPGRWYSVTLWAKRDRPTGWLPELHLFGQRRVINLYHVDVWEKFNWLLNSGEFQGNVVLKLMNRRKPYKVWFDDVSVEEFCVESDLREKLGRLGWRSTQASYPIVFRVEAARSEAFEKTVILGETLNSEILIPSETSEGIWYWRVKAFYNEDLLATSRPCEIDIDRGRMEAPNELPAPREVLPPLRPESSDYISFDEDFNLVVQGDAFFPIGIYSLPPEKFSEAKRAGFNTVLTSEVEAARRAGLRAIVRRGFRYEGKGHESGGTLSGEEANRRIIARYLWDEPAQNNVSPREVFEAHKLEKKDDPHHPTAIVIYRPENFWSYASVSDILMTDPYPVPHRRMTVVSESVRAARKAVGDRKPVWAVIQAFNWMDASQEARRVGWARWPTYQEERCMAYLAVINGAKGIVFFKYCGEDKHDPLNWRALKRVAGQLKELSPILLAQTVTLPASVEVQPPSQPDEEAGKARIEFTIKSDGRRTYLIAANNWPGTRRATFSFGRNLIHLVNLPFEKRKVRARSRSFSDVFGAYAVHVYELRFR